MADIVGVSEIAERASVSVYTVRKWKQRYADFPAPFLELTMGNLYLWSEVKEWVHHRHLV